MRWNLIPVAQRATTKDTAVDLIDTNGYFAMRAGEVVHAFDKQNDRKVIYFFGHLKNRLFNSILYQYRSFYICFEKFYK